MNPSLFYLLPASSTSKTSSSASSISLSSSPATKLASDYSSPAIHKAFYFPTPLVHHPPARKGDFTTSFSSLPLFMALFSSNAPPTKRRLLVSQSPTRTRQIRAHARNERKAPLPIEITQNINHIFSTEDSRNLKSERDEMVVVKMGYRFGQYYT
ncbi:hypothetical protein YC2023_021660 [Brassica napus]